jgi:hypothetical protein
VDLGRPFSFLIHTQSVGLNGRGSARRMATTYTEKMHTDMHAPNWIRTYDPNVQAGEDGSCLSPRGHCILISIVQS